MSQIETLIRVRLQTCAMAVALDNTFMLQTIEEGRYAVPLEYVVPGCDGCDKIAFMFIKWAPHDRYVDKAFVS